MRPKKDISDYNEGAPNRGPLEIPMRCCTFDLRLHNRVPLNDPTLPKTGFPTP